MNEKQMTDEFICTHLGEEPAEQLGATTTPIYQTSSFLEGYEYEYSRGANPNFNTVEKKIAALNRTDRAIMTSCGISAVHAVFLATMKTGDHMIVVRSIYPTARKLVCALERYGITHTFVSGTDLDEIEAAIRPETRLIYLESPSSMVMDLQDLAAISALARSKGIYTAIDNTCASPIFQKPAEFGIDLVLYSGTKYFAGHSDTVCGFVCGNDGELMERVKQNRVLYGYNSAPFNAWLVERGLRTLPARMKQHFENALKVCKYLEKHPAVTEVNYPALESFRQHELYKKQMTGCGGLFSIKTVGSYEQTKEFVKRLRIFTYAASWGGHESLVYPFGTAKPAAEYTNYAFRGGVTRMFAGLENADDMLCDLEQALRVFL